MAERPRLVVQAARYAVASDFGEGRRYFTGGFAAAAGNAAPLTAAAPERALALPQHEAVALATALTTIAALVPPRFVRAWFAVPLDEARHD